MAAGGAGGGEPAGGWGGMDGLTPDVVAPGPGSYFAGLAYQTASVELTRAPYCGNGVPVPSKTIGPGVAGRGRCSRG